MLPNWHFASYKKRRKKKRRTFNPCVKFHLINVKCPMLKKDDQTKIKKKIKKCKQCETFSKLWLE